MVSLALCGIAMRLKMNVRLLIWAIVFAYKQQQFSLCDSLNISFTFLTFKSTELAPLRLFTLD